MSSKGYFTIDLFGKKASTSSSTNKGTSSTMPSQSQDPDVQRAIAVATKAVTKDEEGRIRQAFPLYQEAVGLFLAAVKKESSLGAAERQLVKEQAANYLTRAEELKAQIEKEDRDAEEEEKEKQQRQKRSGSKGRGAKSSSASSSSSSSSSSEGGITRSTAASRAAAAATTAADHHRPSKPDDWDYTGGAGRGAGRGFGRPLGAGGGAAVSGRAGAAGRGPGSSSGTGSSSASAPPGSELESVVMNEMLDKSPNVTWEMIAGLDEAKRVLHEAVVLPNLRPDLFTGLRAPPRGVLLFGPPGTGKTLLAKAVASQSGFSFFSISASSLVSKYLGEGEKMVRALFAVARRLQPAVIFIDEIDSILSARKENEHEATRRLKTEVLVQMDGASTDQNDRILVMGATNLPWSLDTAVLRRMARKVYIPLPDRKAREGLIKHMLENQRFDLPAAHMSRLVAATQGYSCSDLTNLLKEASMEPLRGLDASAIRTIKAEQLRPLVLDDFLKAMRAVRPSVPPASVGEFEKWMEAASAT